MAEVFGANLMSYLRLLTPHELNRLVRANEKRVKVSLTELIASELDLNKDEASKDIYLQSVKRESELEEKPTKDSSPVKQRKSFDETPTPAKYKSDHHLEERESMSTFFLNQKKITKGSQKRLKEKEVLSIYDVIGSSDVQPKDKRTSNEEKVDDLSGLLVNKKAS